MQAPRKRRGQHPPESGEQMGKRKMWSRPVFWLVGVIVTAIGIAITNAIVPRLSEMFDVIPESGEPVLISDVHTYWSSGDGYIVVFRDDVPFTDSMLSQVNTIDGVEAQADWLRENGGAAVPAVYISIAVTGNREDGVRIVDARPIAECSVPHKGALFWAPPQGADDSIRLQFDLDRTGSEPTYQKETGEVVSYFPDKTISLKKNEQQILQIAATTKKHACSFTLEITVLEGNKRKTQIVYDSNGKPFRVSAWAGDSLYHEVYVHTVLCGPDVGWVRSPEPPFRSVGGSYCP